MVEKRVKIKMNDKLVAKAKRLNIDIEQATASFLEEQKRKFS